MGIFETKAKTSAKSAAKRLRAKLRATAAEHCGGLIDEFEDHIEGEVRDQVDQHIKPELRHLRERGKAALKAALEKPFS